MVGPGDVDGRRRVHGTLIRRIPVRPRPEEVVTTTGPHQATLSTLARPDVQPRSSARRRSSRRCATRSATDRVGARAPVRRPARDRQDLPRPHPRQGGQLHEPPGRRSVRRAARLRRHPRGHDPRRARDRRRLEPRHQRGPRPARPAGLSARPPAPQGLHPRRGAPDHPRRLERPAQVARGAARLRDLHVRLDRAVGLPAGDPVAPPALRRPAADGPRDRGQAAAASSRPMGATADHAAITSSPGSPPAGCATPNRCSTSSCRRRRDRITEADVRDLLGLADAEARGRRSSTRCSPATRPPASPSSTSSRSAAATSGRCSTRSSMPIRARLVAHRGPAAPARPLPPWPTSRRRLAAIDPDRAGDRRAPPAARARPLRRGRRRPATPRADRPRPQHRPPSAPAARRRLTASAEPQPRTSRLPRRSRAATPAAHRRRAADDRPSHRAPSADEPPTTDAAPGPAAPPRPASPTATGRRGPPARPDPRLRAALGDWPAIVDRSVATRRRAASRVPADRGRRQRRHPRLPGGEGVPQGPRRAAPPGTGGRHRRRPRPAGQRAQRGRRTSSSPPAPRATTWSPRPAGSSPTSSSMSARSTDHGGATGCSRVRSADWTARHDDEEDRDGHGQPAADGPADAAGDGARPGRAGSHDRPGLGRRRRRQRVATGKQELSASRSTRRRSTRTTSRCCRTSSLPRSTRRCACRATWPSRRWRP